MSYLTNYKEIDGGYVAFGGNPKRGKITGKVPLKLLIDESQVLLRVPRNNNMYSVDLKNIVHKGGLTCLFTKATSDESKLWHRRLGHLNFKTMNNLVKENLVRGLPSKLFENDQTCVACQKGKQHRASYNLIVNAAGTNEVNSVDGKTSIKLPIDPCMPALEDYNIFDFSRDDEDDGVVADMNNLDTTIQVSPNPTTRIHKVHSLDQVIGDLQSATQTRKMSKNLEEHGRTQKGNSCIEGSKLDRGYAGRASTIQVTRSLDFSEFTKWKKGYRPSLYYFLSSSSRPIAM
ncbi:ribonuclease H-like domain-containing protein [Tanacetum coccineum]